MERSNAINILKSRGTIASPGKYTAKVTSVTPYHKRNENGSDQVAIVNFNVMTPYHKESAKTLFGQGDYQEAVNQNLSTSIRESDYMPSKGETVELIVDEITTNNGVKGLFVTSPCIPIKAKATASFNMGEFLDETEGVNILAEEAEEVEVFAKTEA